MTAEPPPGVDPADFRPIDPPMPTPDEVSRRDLPKGRLEACLVMLEHGVNVDRVLAPEARPDVFADDGYLVAIGADLRTSEILTQRMPWPAGLVEALRVLVA